METKKTILDIDNLEALLKSDVDEILYAYETGWVERGIDDKKSFILV